MGQIAPTHEQERQGARRKMLISHCTIFMNWRWR